MERDSVEPGEDVTVVRDSVELGQDVTVVRDSVEPGEDVLFVEVRSLWLDGVSHHRLSTPRQVMSPSRKILPLTRLCETNPSMADLGDFKETVAIVVSSCDAFFDAWRPFHAFWARFWGDCPLDVTLLTNEIEIRSPRMRSIAVGDDRGWSSNMILALERIAHPYVLYFQEDYFLTEPVDRTQLATDFTGMIESGADSLCFRSRSRFDAAFQPLNERYGLVPLDSDGRTRCQVTLWKKSALRSILREGETAWNFEARGSTRTREMRILSYNRRGNAPIRYVMSAISRGLWMPAAIALCRQHGVEINPFFRPIYSERSWLRRWRRTLGRARLRRALAAPRNRVIDLT